MEKPNTMTFEKALKILGLSSSYTDDDLKNVYKILAKKYHEANFIGKSEEEQKAAAEEMKHINAAYDFLKKYDRTSNNYQSNDSYEYGFDSEETPDFFDEYTNAFRAFINTKDAIKKEQKLMYRMLLSEEDYVKACINSDIYNLKSQCNYYNNNSFYNMTRKFGQKRYFPLFFEFCVEAINQINSIIEENGYTYETLKKLDEASIKIIHELFEKYKKAKFKKGVSFGYELLTFFERQFNSTNHEFNELAFDCNFIDLIRSFGKITVPFETELEKKVESLKRIFRQKADLQIDEFINNYISQNNIEIPENGPWTDERVIELLRNRYLDVDFIDNFLNFEYFFNTFIPKEILIKTMEMMFRTHIQKLELLSSSHPRI